MTRDTLPPRRPALHFDVTHTTVSGHQQYFQASLGFYDASGQRPGEVFLSNDGTLGNDIDIAARDIAILISFACQHGASLQDLAAAMTRDPHGAPQGLAGSALDRCCTVLAGLDVTAVPGRNTGGIRHDS